jgi:hypothetical protein
VLSSGSRKDCFVAAAKAKSRYCSKWRYRARPTDDIEGVLDWRFGLASQFGKAEVQDLGVAALGNEYVRGLDVGVDDLFRVGGV